jgi:hypothetical protein
MNKGNVLIGKIVAASVFIFPGILLLSFFLHLNSMGDFFNFRLKPAAYNSDILFNGLVQTRGGSFLHSHVLAYLSVPFMIFTILCLGYLLYPKRPVISFAGVTIGVLGSVFMAGFLASWISFSAIGNVEPQNYTGAKAALVELTGDKGTLYIITRLSLFSLVGINILCTGLFTTKLLPKWSPLVLIAGCLLITIFWSLVNWMFIGSLLILVGMMPVSKLLQSKQSVTN